MIGAPVVVVVLWLAIGWIYWRRAADQTATAF
jgi:hypothetical protein